MPGGCDADAITGLVVGRTAELQPHGGCPSREPGSAGVPVAAGDRSDPPRPFSGRSRRRLH